MKKAFLFGTLFILLSTLGFAGSPLRFHVVIRDGRWEAIPNAYVPVPQIFYNGDQIITKVFNGSNALNVAVVAPGAVSTATGLDQVLNASFNGSNALNVICLSGCGGGGTTVSVNGSNVSTPNFGNTPTVEAGYVLGKWQVTGSNVSVETAIPTLNQVLDPTVDKTFNLNTHNFNFTNGTWGTLNTATDATLSLVGGFTESSQLSAVSITSNYTGSIPLITGGNPPFAGIYVDVSNSSSGNNVDEVAGIFLDVPSVGGAYPVTQAEGLKIANQTGATIGNYAIITGLGVNHFGDRVGIGADPGAGIHLDVQGGASVGTTTYNPTGGAGLNDCTFQGTPTTFAEFDIAIDTTGTPDKFTWSKDFTQQATGVSITGAAQSLSDGVTVTCTATTGHTLSNQWTIQATTGGYAITEGAIRAGPIAVQNLPAASSANAGYMVSVTNSTAIALEGQTCVSGGAAVVALAFSNGTVWKCF